MSSRPIFPIKYTDALIEKEALQGVWGWFDQVSHQVDLNTLNNANALAHINEDGSLTLTIRIPEVHETRVLRPDEWGLRASQ